MYKRVGDRSEDKKVVAEKTLKEALSESSDPAVCFETFGVISATGAPVTIIERGIHSC